MAPTLMDDASWQRLETLFERAVELAPRERAAFVDVECGDDRALAEELYALLAADGELHIESSEAAGPAHEATPMLGDFRLDRRLGRGSSAVAYEASHEARDRQVLVKRLAARLSSQCVRRYAEDATTAARLDHRAIGGFEGVHVSGDGVRFAVSPWYSDHTLEVQAQHRPVPLEAALAIAIELAGALEAAHHAGLVHARVTPSNVVFERSGQIRVVDFGARWLGAGEVRDPESALARWLAPESADEHAVDIRTDVWSVAALIYSMLTASVVLPGASHWSLAMSSAAPFVDRHDPIWRRLPEAVRALLMQALSPRPQERPATMSQMCEQLSRLNRSAARRESVTAPVDDAVLRHLKDVLGAYLGPVSTVIVDEHARRAMSQRSLIDALAAEIDGDEAREDFFRAAARAGARDAQD